MTRQCMGVDFRWDTCGEATSSAPGRADVCGRRAELGLVGRCANEFPVTPLAKTFEPPCSSGVPFFVGAGPGM